jgi:flagellum-specific peptidoglycan hydrolase FlgJ/LysM repeat protein
MKKLHILLFINLIIFTSCSTSKPTVTDNDNKLRNKTYDYYRESNEEAYESMILEKERKEATLGIKKNELTLIMDKETEETLVATSKVKVTKEVVLNYINKYRAVAIDNMNNYNIPASITLAQGILESGCGTSTLSMTANNHFGIKCHTNWEGESVTHTDDAPDECFRKYKNPRDSYRDHSLFLTSRKWYEPLFELDIKDYKAWSHGLKKSGYATDPKYPQKLISLIERYNLNQYDNFYDINKSPVKVTEKVETSNEIEPINVEITEKPLEISKPVEVEITNIQSNPEKNIVSEKTITKEVKSKTPKTHTVVKGDTIYNISKRYNLSTEKLRTLNKIVENNISLGQVLIVE